MGSIDQMVRLGVCLKAILLCRLRCKGLFLFKIKEALFEIYHSPLADAGAILLLVHPYYNRTFVPSSF